MDFAVRWVDVEANLATGVQPVVFVERDRNHSQPKAWAGQTQVGHPGDYWVPQDSLLSEDPKWAVTKVGEVVRVPIVAYKTSFPSYAAIFGLGVQLGLAALIGLRDRTGDKPTMITLLLGQTCHDLREAEQAFQCYVGLTIRTK